MSTLDDRLPRMCVRIFLAFSISVGGGSFRAVCEASPPRSGTQEVVTIEIGNLVIGRHEGQQDGPWMRGEIESFKAAHPHIDVKTSALHSPDREDKPIEDLARLAENVIGISSAPGYETAHLVSEDLIVPIEKFLPDPDFSLDVFYESQLQPVTHDGKHWGVPWLCNTVVLVCNWPLFQEAGIEKPPATWDEFLATSEALTKDNDGDGQMDQWGFIVNLRSPHHENMWASMVLQQGGSFYNEQGVDMSHPACKEAFKMLERIKNSPSTVIGHSDIDDEISMKKYGMQIVRHSSLPPVSRKNYLRIAPLPSYGESISLNERSLYLAVRKSTPQKERASFEFLKWISRPDSTMPAVLAAGYPCRKDFVERDEFKQRSEFGAQNLRTAYTVFEGITDPGPPMYGRWYGFGRCGELIGNWLMEGEPASIDELARLCEREGTKLLQSLNREEDSTALFR